MRPRLIQHIDGDCYSVHGTLVYANSIDAFNLRDHRDATDAMDVLSHWSKNFASDEEKLRASRKMDLIAKKWKTPAPVDPRRITRLNNREQQWLGMLEKLIDTIALYREACHPEVKALARRYRNALSQTELPS